MFDKDSVFLLPATSNNPHGLAPHFSIRKGFDELLSAFFIEDQNKPPLGRLNLALNSTFNLNVIHIVARNQNVIDVLGDTRDEALQSYIHSEYIEDHYRQFADDARKQVEAVFKDVVDPSVYVDHCMKLYNAYVLNPEQIPALHLVVSGPSGVGKTTHTPLLAQAYYNLGLLPSSKHQIVTRKELTGRYIGRTDKITAELLSKMAGGMVVIDEAHHTLNDPSSADFAHEAREALVSHLGNPEKASTCAIVLVGYPEGMEALFQQNQGLRSRFPNTIQLGHLPNRHLVQLVTTTLHKNGFECEAGVEHALWQHFDQMKTGRYRDFGNGRDALEVAQKLMDAYAQTTALKNTGGVIMPAFLTRKFEQAKSTTNPRKSIISLNNLKAIKPQAERFAMPAKRVEENPFSPAAQPKMAIFKGQSADSGPASGVVVALPDRTPKPGK